MKYSASHPQPEHRKRPFGSAWPLNPYCIEDIALTPRELDRARATDTRVIVPR